MRRRASRPRKKALQAQLPGSSGQKVAVKVLRPDIQWIIESDLETLESVVVLLKRHTKIKRYTDVDLLYEDFAQTIGNELDLVREGKSAETVQRNLLDNAYVSIPQIFWSHTSKKVLTMEFMEGIKINDIEALDKLGIDKDAVARNLLTIYLQMILEAGFFHADPHPGNVLVGEDGAIVLLDFGMMGQVTQEMRDGFIEFVTAVFIKDSHRVVAVLCELGFIREDSDTEVFAIALSQMLDKLVGGDPSAAAATLEGSIEEVREFMYSQPFQLPSTVTFLGKALLTVLGLCMSLNPQMNLVEEVKPLAEELLGVAFTGEGASGFFDQAKRVLKPLGASLLKVPTIIDRMESGKLIVRLSADQTREFLAAQNAGAQKIVRTIIGAVLFLAGIYLVVRPGLEVLAGILIGCGALIMLVQTRPIKGARKRRPRHPGL